MTNGGWEQPISYELLDDFIARWGTSRRTYYRYVEKGRIPPPIKITERRSAVCRQWADKFLHDLAEGRHAW